MDFDLKRLPDPQTFHTVYPVINETTYEIANFETRPYTSIEQYRKYKSIGKSCVVLRTENDWSVFFRKSYAKKAEVSIILPIMMRTPSASYLPLLWDTVSGCGIFHI